AGGVVAEQVQRERAAAGSVGDVGGAAVVFDLGYGEGRAGVGFLAADEDVADAGGEGGGRREDGLREGDGDGADEGIGAGDGRDDGGAVAGVGHAVVERDDAAGRVGHDRRGAGVGGVGPGRGVESGEVVVEQGVGAERRDGERQRAGGDGDGFETRKTGRGG